MARKALLIVAFVTVIQGCRPIGFSDCEDETKLEVKSPDGRYVATWYERDCGATTTFSNIVSLRAVGSSFDPNDDGARVFVAKHRPRLKLHWQDDSTLRVDCEECPKEDVVQRATSWHDVMIVHSTHPAEAGNVRRIGSPGAYFQQPGGRGPLDIYRRW